MNRGGQSAGLSIQPLPEAFTFTKLNVLHLVSKMCSGQLLVFNVFLKLFFSLSLEENLCTNDLPDPFTSFCVDTKVIALASSRSCLFFLVSASMCSPGSLSSFQRRSRFPVVTFSEISSAEIMTQLKNLLQQS